ncbi:MAG: hypothetical protein HKP30_12095, partial [Myxococcales bacterium]|nr:hypothetical protein [Myxococcales bacterium]
MMRWIGLLIVMLAATAHAADAELAALAHGTDYGALGAVETRARERALAEPDDFDAQLAGAEVGLVVANRLRLERKIVGDMPDDRNDAYRDMQAQWAEDVLPFAERALELAGDDAQRAQAERVLGELYAHKIRGMLTGMVNGPRARRHIGRALDLAPEDPECQRAIGLMYLNNPPISGGDVSKAIETFRSCAEALPDERCVVLLAMSYRKAGRLDEARDTAEV